jgi:integrase
MPSVQRGQAYKAPAGTWATRYYDADGTRRSKGGFPTKSVAREWVESKVVEVEALRRGDAIALARVEEITFADLADRFLAAHEVDPATLAKLRTQLVAARSRFGDRPIRTLRPDELAAWRKNLPGNHHHLFRAVKQVLTQAERWGWIEQNPARHVKNPKPKAPEIQPFADWPEVEAIAAELGPRFAAIPIFAVGTGLRPEEWIALERRDLDRAEGVVHVRRVYTQGVLKECAKTNRQRRRVPLRGVVLDALDALPPRLDSPLLFPAARGGYIELGKFRSRFWKPALRAAGVDHRRVYDTRHTFASWALRDGVSLFYLSRVMGTSVAQIDATYGHMVPDSEDHIRTLLDAGDSKRQQAFGH